MIALTDQKLIDEIKVYILQRHQCHTVILYGSRARGESKDTSDYDIIAIREHGELIKDCKIFNGFYLDAFIYSEDEIANPDPSLIRINDGIVLCQRDSLGDKLLNQISLMFQQGPTKTPNWEKLEITIWVEKMLNRVKNDDIEGNFRRCWLLYSLLECYFKLRDLWYLGPNKAFLWLKKNDSIVYIRFKEALEPGASIDTIEHLMNAVLIK
ncbi:MAG: nucleotidyltransferase domain-containing protein [Gammaproteobacteria bacterium]